MKVEELVAITFRNEHEKVLALLERHNLLNIIKTITDGMYKNEAYINEGLQVFANSFLTQINSTLRGISNIEEKEEVEYTIGQLALQLINHVVTNSNFTKSEAISHIDSGLKAACELGGYDYETLNKILPLAQLKGIIDSRILYYEWKGTDDNFTSLCKDLKSIAIISDISEFKELFQKHSIYLQIQFDPNHLDFLIILFDELYAEGFIQPKGERCGKFSPLKAYAVDFDKKPLISKPPKHLKLTIKKNSARYNPIHNKITKWLSFYQLKS